MEIKQQAVNKLANSMRLYVEQHMRFKELISVDKEEAIDNLDRAFEAKLEAFHSLYDVTKNNFDYFAHGDVALIILLRNAIHHCNHLLFKTWNQDIALHDRHNKYLGAEFLLASHEVVNASYTMRHFYKLEDFYLRLDSELGSPYVTDRISPENKHRLLKQIKDELSFELITAYAKDNRFPIGQIYINLIPIFISAVCKIFKSLKNEGMDFVGFDARAFEEPFTNELIVDFTTINYDPIRVI